MAGKPGMHKGFNPSQDARTRAKIQTSQIVNRLKDFVDGKIEMAPHAVTAALGLLRKVLPDLASVEHQVNQVQPFAVLPSEIKNVAEWEQSAIPEKPTEH